jgi:peptide/nickel transport system substrate-binding protein
MIERRERPAVITTAVLAVVALVAIACGSGSSGDGATDAQADNAPVSENEPTSGGTIVMAVTAETNGWNPALAQWADAGNFVGSSFLEPLLVYNSKGEVVPWLAESMTSDSDAYDVWTVKVRPGITFHDGTELKAQNVKAGLELAINEGLSGIALGDYFDRVDVIDDYTAKIFLTIKWATFPNVLAGPNGYQLGLSMLSLDDKGASHPVGTGPYEFVSWVPDQSVKVQKFDGCWGGPCALPSPPEAVAQLCEDAGVPLGQPNGPFLEAMEFRPIPDAQQRANALRSGDVDLLLTTRANDVAAMRGDYTVVTNYDGEQTLVMTSVNKPPFDNEHARRALAYATDRQPIVDLVSAGEDLVSDTWPFSESSPWGQLAESDNGYPAYDPARASEELEQYKADTGQPTLSFTFSGLANTADLDIMQALIDQWSAVGIEAQIDTIEQTAYIGRLVANNFEAAYFRNYAYPDPDSLYSFWSSTTAGGPISINFTQYYSDATDAALSTGRETTDFDTRREAYDRLMRERNEQAIELWLFNTPYALIGDRDVHGLNWFRIMGFGNFLPKPWIGGLWLDQGQG